jgi:hypothetical protein
VFYLYQTLLITLKAVPFFINSFAGTELSLDVTQDKQSRDTPGTENVSCLVFDVA